jgi:hypothetical protein
MAVLEPKRRVVRSNMNTTAVVAKPSLLLLAKQMMLNMANMTVKTLGSKLTFSDGHRRGFPNGGVWGPP